MGMNAAFATRRDVESNDECKCGHARGYHYNLQGLCRACQSSARYGACTFYQKSEVIDVEGKIVEEQKLITNAS